MTRFFVIGLIGLAGGLTSGLFGVGGGVLFVPLLTLLCAVNLHQAIGTSLVVIIPTAFVGAIRNVTEGTVDFKIALLLSLFAMIGAWVGAGLSLKLDINLLRKSYAVFLFALAFKLFFKS